MTFEVNEAEDDGLVVLFSSVGGVPFVHSKFGFISSHILLREKASLAGQWNINGI